MVVHIKNVDSDGGGVLKPAGCGETNDVMERPMMSCIKTNDVMHGDQ